jgi:N-glycosidase YbiA
MSPKLVKVFILGLLMLISSNCSHSSKQKHFITPPLMAKGPVNFYSRRNPYGEFSNFANFPITVEGKLWPTSEHYYQAKKFLDSKTIEKIRLTIAPEEAAHLGRTLECRKDWHDVKVAYMWTALKAKYTQHERLKTLLLSTNTQSIFEHTENDFFWGDGGNGTGKNILGLMLMKLRGYIKIDNGKHPENYVWK